jgi:hypothetical protein
VTSLILLFVYAVPGLVIMAWFGAAQEEWLRSLEQRGAIPTGTTRTRRSPTMFVHPLLVFRATTGISGGLLRSKDSGHPREQLWRTLMIRRLRVFVGWAIGGALVASAAGLILELASENTIWLLLLAPLAAVLAVLAVPLRRYGDYESVVGE